MDSDIILANARRSDEDSSAAFERATANEGLRRRFPQEADDGQREFTLPPADGGRSAWLFLAGCFAVEALMWGILYNVAPAANG